jgi:mRNA interferase RelE/StbE
MAGRQYTILLLPSARRALAGLPIAVRRRLGRAIDALATDPRPPGAKLLAGKPADRIWRLRAGDYRVLYDIRDAELVVLVIRVGHRREVYRGP